MTPPGGGPPREVDVYDDEDWMLIHRRKDMIVLCKEPGCETRLIAKARRATGTRFFAVGRGQADCRHEAVSHMPQPAPDGPSGGGPETDEHLWMKRELAATAASIDRAVTIEDFLTHADVYLPDARLAIEYQRWDTDFTGRTAARASVGAERTLWLMPARQHPSISTARMRRFEKEVFWRGAMFLSVRHRMDPETRLEPWHRSTPSQDAELYVHGSLARFDRRQQALVRCRRRFIEVLTEIVSGELVLTDATIHERKIDRSKEARVWVLREDLELAEQASQGSERRDEQKPDLASDSTPPPETGTSAPDGTGTSPEMPHRVLSPALTSPLLGEGPPVPATEGVQERHPISDDSQTRSAASPSPSSPLKAPWWRRLVERLLA